MAPSLLAETEAAAFKDFNLTTPAFAYVYTHNGVKGLRLEAPDLVKEFSNGVPLGRDPKGTFYYKNYADFSSTSATNFKVSYPSRGTGYKTEKLIVIDFFFVKTPTRSYAKFIALLPPRAHDDAVAFDGPAGGKWNKLDVTQATALASSDSTDTLVTISIQSLGKRFEFNIPTALQDELGSTAFNTWGYLIVGDVGKLAKNKQYYVDYTCTRIIIFEKQGDTNPVAVFGSYEIDPNQPTETTFQVTGGQFFDGAN